MFNARKIFPAFDENTGEIYLPSLGKIVPFERAIRKNKMDKSVRVFDPRSNKDLCINDAIERALIDKTSGMIIDPKSGGCGGLLSIKEAVKRGVVSVTGAPLVTGHHESEGGVESAVITSRKLRHTNQHGHFDNVENHHLHKHRHQHHSSETKRVSSKVKTRIEHDTEYLSSDLLHSIDASFVAAGGSVTIKQANEEGRKRYTREGDVIQRVRGDFKETVLEAGRAAKVTSKGSYENVESKSSGRVH